ncbi:MCP four helix bundle domain-containing protein [Herbaspirillum sp. LeCh32-8]|uniref:methyl-accepting chemotaxis protein n=1 Tax=Herbaspirillum sp. LeCh32-8 TaxID=2821356 RepID=UPI001AE7F386|nr:methyl-accepting chemotaxis protein [Herbaspirillum sp. LeCh32-8]MBP0600300.1 MCP four helix bundle domain-containing protein [Herbaspirillum sp. LeCh32-8]
MPFKNTKVATKLGLGFGLVLLLLAAITAIGIARMVQINAQVKNIVDINNVEISAVMTMRAAIFEQSIAVRNVALMSDRAAIDRELDGLIKQDERYKTAQAKLQELFGIDQNTSGREKELLATATSQSAAASTMFARAVELSRQGEDAELKRFITNEIGPRQIERRGTLADLAALEDESNREAGAHAHAVFESARLQMLVIGGAALLIGVIASLLIARNLLRQLGGEPSYAADIAQKIAVGDLTVEVAVAEQDKSSMLFAMKQMRDALTRIVAQVRQGTDTIATASSEIARGNLDLSSRTEEQASSLEETASSMEELTSTVRQNADNARQANQLASSASSIASEGGQVVQQVVDTMGSINESSRKIVDIIGVIDGIAFQTNILALNAAVEAARAGEQGRGFAVVASEVRTLAQRSASAAKEIKQLIDDSVAKVDTGSKLVAQAGGTMDQVVSSVRQVTDIVSEISASSREQSDGIEQINQAVVQMDQVTQQNAALVEEAAAAAQSLQDQADSLQQIVSIFRIDGRQLAAMGKPAQAQRVPQAQAPRSVPAPPTSTSPGRATEAQRPALPANAEPTRSKAVAGDDDWEQF